MSEKFNTSDRCHHITNRNCYISPLLNVLSSLPGHMMHEFKPEITSVFYQVVIEPRNQNFLTNWVDRSKLSVEFHSCGVFYGRTEIALLQSHTVFTQNVASYSSKFIHPKPQLFFCLQEQCFFYAKGCCGKEPEIRNN